MADAPIGIFDSGIGGLSVLRHARALLPHEELLYFADDQGNFTAIKAATGEKVYGPEPTGVGRTSASPILADGKLYLVGESAETAVVQAGPAFKLLAKNALDGSYTLCTPAFVGGTIYLRTGTHLYAIAK